MRIDNDVTKNALTSMQVQKKQAEDATFKAKLETVMSEKDKNRLKEVCQDFEAVFLNLMLQSMRATVPKSELLGRSMGKDIFESLLDQETSKNMAKAGGIGLADMMFKQLSNERAVDKTKNSG
jgi:flagellar protein FlgJ